MRLSNEARTNWGLLLACLVASGLPGAWNHAARVVAADAESLEVLRIAGGCCHDYATQTQLLKKGIESRVRSRVDVVHNPDRSTKATFDIYQKDDWDRGYDVVLHDECSADVTDPAYVGRILAAHRRGTPAVNLHCAMHSYRWGNFREPVATGADNAGWYEMLGLQSTGHGPQLPIAIAFSASGHPITRGLVNWNTINEELYNNIKVLPGATVLAHGRQTIPPNPNKEDSKPAEVDAVVAWTNEYGPNRTRIFSTSLGHNNDTVADDRYLDFVTRGLLWSAGRLRDDGSPAPELALSAGEQSSAGGWAGSISLPESERSRSVRLFNGRDFDGWEGHIDPYWTVDGGEIVGRNTAENAPKVSTYLLTKRPYRNFRLLFEGKLAQSEMHSGVSLWGRKFDKDGEASSYQGHLVMFPSGWGLYDLYRRNGLSGDQQGKARAAADGRQHDWNRMEILAIGSRIRLAVNGREVLDWTDPKPELCEEGPIGLQLHSNTVPQEVRFRGLVIVENPGDMLVTAEPTPAAPSGK
ncbi:MAG: family 16 glycoside hydrolase [Planctomycetaceae bacterium]